MDTPDHEQSERHRTPPREETRGEGPAFDPASSLGNDAVRRVLGSNRIQRGGATSAQHLDEAVSRAIQERQGRGDALDEETRERMEDGLGHDLSDVRIHTDDAAHELSEAVDAKAFTAGSDVFFTRGTYDPASASGRELLGHELTHVVQQRTGTSGLRPGEVSKPTDASERQAAETGRALASGGPSTDAGVAAGPSVGRQAEEEEEEPVMMSRDVPAARQATDEEEDLELE